LKIKISVNEIKLVTTSLGRPDLYIRKKSATPFVWDDADIVMLKDFIWIQSESLIDKLA